MEKASKAYLTNSELTKLFNIMIYTNICAYLAVNHSHKTWKYLLHILPGEL